MNIVDLEREFGRFCREGILPLFIADWRKLVSEVLEKDNRELVGTLDVAIQHHFLDFAVEYLPDWPVVSEEADYWPLGYPPPVTNWWEEDRFCVLDPLDGTHNHLMGLPLETVMFTLVDTGRPIFSAIFNPMRELARGDGYFTASTYDDRVIQYRSAGEPADFLSVSADSELGSVMGLLEGSTGNIVRSDLAQRYMRSVRRWRSAFGFGQSVALLASGGNHAAGAGALVSIKNKFTDNIHGVLFTELADGMVTRSDGEPWVLDNPDPVDLVFSNGIVHDQILELVNN